LRCILLENIRLQERVGIGTYPTPLEAMPRLSEDLGVRLLVKREDMTGLAMGGNKTRTLDYLLVQAKKDKADAVITTCGIQSNWSRQTVAAAIKLGMKPSLVLRTAQFKTKPKVLDGNILLDHIMGADIRVVKMGIDEDPEEYLQEQAARLRKKGFKNPVILGPKLSSSPPVACAYAECVFEMQKQMEAAGIQIDALVVANGSGATQAGIALGVKILGLKTKVIGVNIGAYETKKIIGTILESSAGASKLFGTSVELSRSDVEVRDGYDGKGYGIPTKSSDDALRLVARREGLIIDPVYTAKTMAFLIDSAKDGEFKGKTVCFMHTGGIPALFPYRSHFQPSKPIR